MPKGKYDHYKIRGKVRKISLEHRNKLIKIGKEIGKKHLIGYNCRKKGKSYEEQYGKLKAEYLKELRKKQAKEQKIWKRFPDTKGSNNPRWVGGTINWRGTDWSEIRNFILIRDNHICQKCGSKERLIVDHKIPYRFTKDNSFENLQVLCRSCHVGKDWEILKYLRNRPVEIETDPKVKKEGENVITIRI